MAEFITAVILTFVLIPVGIRLLTSFNILDRPTEKSLHKTPVPTMGGIVLTAIFLLILNIRCCFAGMPISDFHSFVLLQLLLIAVTVVGMIDDLRPLTAVPKIAAITAAGAIFAFAVADIHIVTVPFVGRLYVSPILSWALTVGWIVVVTSAINVLDGLDGLLPSYAAIYFISLYIIGMIHNPGEPACLTAIMAGMSLGFLIFNKPPARIFLGNAGSQFIGFMIAVTPLINNIKAPASINILPAIIILSYPIIDLFVQFSRRLLNGKNPFCGDLYHFHHICYYLNLGQPKYLVRLVWIFLLNALFSITTAIAPLMWRPVLVVAAYMVNMSILATVILRYRHNGHQPLIYFNETLDISKNEAE